MSSFFSSQYDTTQDTIFISGLPEETTEKQLEDYFGAIGIIKKDKKTNSPKIWIYRDKATGRGKGEATITYDDPPTAGSAIKWFSNKDFHGSTITVEFAQRKSAPPSFGANRGGGPPHRDSGDRCFNDRGRSDRGDRGERPYDRDRGSRGDDRRQRPHSNKGNGRPGDWACLSCNNNNFSYRTECNRCHEPKPAGGSTDVNTSKSSSQHEHHDRSSYADRGRDSNYRNRSSHRDGGGPTRPPHRDGHRDRPY